METSLEPAPIVTKDESSFTESSQERKSEQITNGTIETAVSTEKSVNQSSVVTSDNQTIQQKR